MREVTIETVTMAQLSDLQTRARASGNGKLADAAARAARGYRCQGALRRCVAAINATSAEGKRLAAPAGPRPPAAPPAGWVITITKRGGIAESRLAFGRYEIVVHHHMDEDPGQWLYSCHRLGVERRPIAKVGDSIETAQAAAIVDLARHLDEAQRALGKVAP